MQTSDVGLIGLLILLALAALAIWSWISRGQRQSKQLPDLTPLVKAVDGLRALYVATTFADRPLERVFAHGLAHRGVAFVGVSKEGVSVSRNGERSFLIPTSSLLYVGASSAVIDRVVEKNGLTSIRWRLGSSELETHFRIANTSDRSGIVVALNSLVGA